MHLHGNNNTFIFNANEEHDGVGHLFMSAVLAIHVPSIHLEGKVNILIR